MIELEFCKKSLIERKKIVEEFRRENMLRRDSKKLNTIDSWCKKYLSHVNGIQYDFFDIVEALPDELLEIKEYLDNTYDIPKIMSELPYGKKYCYIETSLYSNMRIDAKRKLLNSLNVIVCPYCNRNYIVSDENISTCELDHFISKRKYPIFASSFYNLIPACPYCNRKKNDKEFKIFPHIFPKSTDELLRFTYKILGSDYLTNIKDLDIVLEILDIDYSFQANILKLEDLYKHHKDIVQDALKKRQVFSDAYIDSLGKEFPMLFKSRKDVEELIYGISMEKENYGKRPLTKLLQDIVREIR